MWPPLWKILATPLSLSAWYYNYSKGRTQRMDLYPQLHIVIVRAVTEQAWCADLKVLLQEVTNSAHACSIGPRYLKFLMPKKRNKGNSSGAWANTVNQFTHICLPLTHKGIIMHGGWKKKEEKNYEKKMTNLTMRSRSDNCTPGICECPKTNKMILSYMIQTWSFTLWCHLISTLKFHTNQPISGLIERNTLRPNF